jgi:hypothetical protein
MAFVGARTEWPAPSSEVPSTVNLLHLLGDLHFGATTTLRTNAVAADLPNCPTPVARVAIGDITNTGIGAEDALALPWLAGLSPAVPTYGLVGNHDIYLNVRTVAQWCAAYSAYIVGGVASYTVDLSFARLIFLSPDALFYPATGPGGALDSVTIQLSAATLTYLGAQCAGTAQDCIIFCHAPLNNTVLGGANYYQSTDGGFYVVGPNGTDDTEVRAVLAAHNNARMWICGHTHSDITCAGFVKTLNLSGKTLVHLNLSAIYFTTKVVDVNNPLFSLFMDYQPGVSVQVFFRNHRAQTYEELGGAPTVVAL